MPLSRVAAIFALLMMPASSVAAQSNLGQLLDAGGEKLSAEQFKRELVGRPMSGPTSTGQNLDVVYLINGEIRGTGTYAVTGGFPQGSAYDITGVWTVDANDR